MSKKSELIKNTIILTVGKICTQLVSFLLLPLYTALLEPGQYGAVDLFNTYCTLSLPIFNWQFDNGLFRFLLDARDDNNYQKSIFTTVMNANFFQSLLYILFYILMRNYITLTYKMYLALDILFSIFLYFRDVNGGYECCIDCVLSYGSGRNVYFFCFIQIYYNYLSCDFSSS